MSDTNGSKRGIAEYVPDPDRAYEDVPEEEADTGAGFNGVPRCFVCGHEWLLKGVTLPVRCPKCRSTRWNNPDIVHNECKRCGHGWISTASIPCKCPKCQSLKWNEHPNEHSYECRRCSYTWKAIKINPVKCPRCKSSKWNEPLKEYYCPKCKRSHVIKSNSRPGMCPSCDPRMNFHKCVKCGFSWKRVRGHTTEKCPSCGSDRWCDRETPGKISMKKETAKKKLFDILQFRKVDNVVEDLAELLDVEMYQADIYIKYMGGETPVRISMQFNISFEHTMGVISRIGDAIRRF